MELLCSTVTGVNYCTLIFSEDHWKSWKKSTMKAWFLAGWLQSIRQSCEKGQSKFKSNGVCQHGWCYTRGITPLPSPATVQTLRRHLIGQRPHTECLWLDFKLESLWKCVTLSFITRIIQQSNTLLKIFKVGYKISRVLINNQRKHVQRAFRGSPLDVYLKVDLN